MQVKATMKYHITSVARAETQNRTNAIAEGNRITQCWQQCKLAGPHSSRSRGLSVTYEQTRHRTQQSCYWVHTPKAWIYCDKITYFTTCIKVLLTIVNPEDQSWHPYWKSGLKMAVYT